MAHMNAISIVPQSSALKALLERGFLEQCSDFSAVDRALATGMLTFYIGYDPTAPSFHVGNLLTIMAMRLLQRHGHRPICLLGTGTAMVGDPSGKTEMRKLLSQEQVARHTQACKQQLEHFIHFHSGQSHDAMMVNNADWLAKLNYIEFLRDIGKHFTINRMLTTKTYRDRLEQNMPLSFLEFNYQLLQAYDFLYLYDHYQCHLQLGGSDQWGNMIAGVELIRRFHADKPSMQEAYCLTFPLLTTADGRKMGKTEAGAVWLDANLLPPYEYYQYWINRDDRDVPKLLRLFTDLSLAEIEELTTESGSSMREATQRLAFETTRLLHGEEAATQAMSASRQVFSESTDWSGLIPITLSQVPISLVDLLMHAEIQVFRSKRETRQRISSGAVLLNEKKLIDPQAVLSADDFDQGELRLKIGKRRFRIILAS